MELRVLSKEEKPAAMALCWRVFLQFEAPDYPPEGAVAFRSYIEDAETVNALAVLGAFDGTELTGVLAAEENHVAVFFVDPAHHRRGVGRALLARLLENRRALLRPRPFSPSGPGGIAGAPRGCAPILFLERQKENVPRPVEAKKRRVPELAPAVQIPANTMLVRIGAADIRWPRRPCALHWYSKERASTSHGAAGGRDGNLNRRISAPACSALPARDTPNP